MVPEKIKKIIADCEKNALQYEQMAKILRDYADIQVQLNVTGAMIINREDKQARLKELADKFNELSLSNLFMTSL